MRVGVVGLGKLGLPVALALGRHHEVMGWDSSIHRRRAIRSNAVPEERHEPDLGRYRREAGWGMTPIPEIIEWRPDVVLVCVQTPHEPPFEGVIPLDEDAQDFDYAHLRDAIVSIDTAVSDEGWTGPLVVIVSTCLPGTFEREIRPLDPCFTVAYHPLFIAMGSVIEDFEAPEFVLVGADKEYRAEAVSLIRRLYAPIHSAPVSDMSITSAELTKVAYNSAIGFKLLLANTVAQLADKLDANCDDVMGTLECATKRIVSTAYMRSGMGDGGGCHPRDQIALSWLANQTDISADPFGFIVRAREGHARWLARVWWDACLRYDLRPIMLGDEYKANTHLRTGSHARLVAHYLAHVFHLQPEIVYGPEVPPVDNPPGCYFLSCPHEWAMGAVPPGSVLVDPWGAYPADERITTVRPGRRV